MQSRFLLKPDDDLNELINGVIGRAMARFREIHMYLYVVASNHYHLMLSAPDLVTLSDFMCFLNSNIARESGRFYDWREKFWGGRYHETAIMDEPSLLAKARYILSHGCKENLVERPGEWPGVQCVNALTKGDPIKGRWVDRGRESEYRKLGIDYDIEEFSSWHTVHLSPLPMHEDWSDDERQQFWLDMTEEIEEETRRRLHRENQKVLGVYRIRSQDPYGSPAMSKRSPKPICHAADKEAIKDFRDSYRAFVNQFREALGSFLGGDLSSLMSFPEDCCLPPVVNRLWTMPPPHLLPNPASG